MLEREKVLQLKSNLEELEYFKEVLKERQALFDKSNIETIEKIEMFKTTITTQKDELREVAEQEYRATMNKQLLGGLGVRISKILTYDKKDALKWAREHDLCMVLDTKAFEKIAKAQDIDFVGKEDSVTITFPKDITI